MISAFFRLSFLSVLCIVTAAYGATVPMPPPPSITAASYVLMDYRTGQILAEKNATVHRKPASTTKLMTAYVVFQDLAAGRITPQTKFTVSVKAWHQIGSRMFLKPGSKVSVQNLILGMLVPSGNDAAMTLAQGVAGTEAGFVNMMNADAQALGLKDTHYENPTGLPKTDHYTSALDLAKLSRDIIKNFPERYRKYFAHKQFTWNGITQTNYNKLLWMDSTVDGLKTGYTEHAGYCLSASAKRGNQRLIAVVMGVPGLPHASLEAEYQHLAQVDESLLDYGFRFYQTHQLYPAHKRLGQIRVWKGGSKYVPVGTAKDVYVTVPAGHYGALKIKTHMKSRLEAPVKADTAVGEVTVKLGKKTLTTVPLVTLNQVPKGGFWPWIRDTVLGWF